MMVHLSPDFEKDKLKEKIIMAEKTIKTRIIHKHDTEENWNKAINFIPKQGEIIVYDVDATHAYERFKIGDGVTNVNSLPFSYSHIDNYYYFDDIESMVTAINNNTFSEDNKEQLSTSVVQITTGLDALIIDILADVTTESDLSISKSCIINLNGHTVTVNNDGRLKFINSASPTEVIINAAGATIQRAGTQSAAKSLITFMGYSLTINGGHFNEYNSRDNAATMCSPLAVNNITAKIYVYGARFEAAGRYRGLGTYLYKFSSFEATNSTFVGGALQASSSAYSADQTMGIGFDCGNIDGSSATSIVKLNNCVCSGEVMAANFACKLEAVGTTFESCDHGLYVQNSANLQSCTFVHKSWANLIAAQLQYPFKDGETKVKTQYSETHAEYANLGFCYIGSPVYNASAIMNNCLEQIDSEKETENAHIVLSTNYNYKAPSLYLSNHTALYSIRVDPDRGKGAAKLYVGENVTIPSFGDTVGYVDESSYAGIGFYSGFNVHEGLHNGITQVDKKLDKVTERVDYTYLPKYRLGSSPLLNFGGFSESSTEYQIDHLSEVIDPSAVYFVAKGGKETYIKPELITEELKTKYHVSSGIGNDARYYIPITDELIVLEYYISPTEAYYYLHTSADSIGTVEEVYVGKAQKLIDDSYASYYNLWSAQKTKESINGKLDKITTTDGYNRAYGVSYEGNQMSFRVDNSAIESTLAQRDSNGNIKVGTPVEDGDATPKSYVDGKVDDSTTDTNHAWSGSKVNNALNGLAQGMSGMGNGLQQAINGKLDKVTTKSEVNRLYGIRTSGEQHVYTASYKPISYAIPMYDLDGTLRASSPIEDTHCANKQYVDAQVQSANYTVPIVDSPPTTHLPTKQGQMYMEERTNKFYIAVDAGGLILWKEVQFSDSGSSGQSITYTLSISGNVITLTGSDGSTSPIALPVYNGGVS